MKLFDKTLFRTANEKVVAQLADRDASGELALKIEGFLKSYRQLPDYSAYHYLTPESQQLVDRISTRYDPAKVASFYRCVLMRAIECLHQWLDEESLPDSILDLYSRNISRILDELTKNADEFYSLTDDRFVKDLCLSTVRMYPGGGRLLEPKCGLPRQLLFRGGLKNLPMAAASIAFRLGGFRPLVQFHTHKSDLQDFNPEGMEQTYHRVADLLEKRPKLRGLYTASWFNDPIVSSVSPRLTYLRELPQNNGAFLLRGAIDDNSTNAAISRSPTRRELYRQGKYQPTIYVLVWPRESLIRWSRGHR